MLRDALITLLGPTPDPALLAAGVGRLAPTGSASSQPDLTASRLFAEAPADPTGRRPSGRRGRRRAAQVEGVSAPIDLDELVTELTPAVYRLARSVVRDPGLADDVAQETFIKVWKHLDEFRGDGSVRGWVLRIAHNTAVSTLRRIRDTATDPTWLPHEHDPISTNRVVEGRLAHDDLLEELEALDELSREIVVLREVEGLSYDEIAEALDVPIPTVKTRLLRARRRLAAALEGWRP